MTEILATCLQASSMSGDGRGDPGAASWGEYMKDNPLARRIKEWQTGLSSKLSFGSRDGAGR